MGRLKWFDILFPSNKKTNSIPKTIKEVTIRRRVRKSKATSYFAFMSDNEYDAYERAVINGTDATFFTNSMITHLESKATEYRENTDALNKAAQLNNKGICLEKSGKIEKAISVYEENIKSGYSATHSFDRLVILYRKLKRYGDEERLLYNAIKVFKEKSTNMDYQDRVNKLNTIIKNRK